MEATASDSVEVTTSLSVSEGTLAFCVPGMCINHFDGSCHVYSV